MATNYKFLDLEGLKTVFGIINKKDADLKTEIDKKASKEELAAAIEGVDVSAQLVNYPDSAEYVSASKQIQFKHNGTLLPNMTVDATEFVKDGMVESVEISEDGTKLIITWNTDSGKSEATEIELSKIFNPEDYYTKGQIDSTLGGYLTKTEAEGTYAKTADLDTFTAITDPEIEDASKTTN